jgi:CubicO group peptidase (beta-lactamase class C family)
MEAGSIKWSIWAKQKLYFAEPPYVPGTNEEYSNLAYALAGLAVGRVSGKPFRDVLMDDLLRPLKMNDTGWDYGKLPPNTRATGYHFGDGQYTPATPWELGAAVAMGGLHSTIDDMARFIAFELSAWPPRDEPDSGPVSRATLRESQRPLGPTPFGQLVGAGWHFIRVRDGSWIWWTPKTGQPFALTSGA